LDVYNVTNTSSFDVPGNEVSQNAFYNSFPASGTPVLPLVAARRAQPATSTVAPADWAS